MSTILLTGASGFLGSAIANALIDHADHLLVIKRHSSNLSRLANIEKQITFYNVEDLEYSNPFKRDSIDLVIHAATAYGRLGESEEQIYEANLHFPTQLLKMAVTAKVKTFVNIDTVIPSDINSYALSKREFCYVGKRMADREVVNFINVRLEHIYGPGDASYKFVQWLLESCLKNVPKISLTKGLQQRDFIYVSDAVDGLMTILNHLNDVGDGFQEVALGSGNSIVIRDFVTLVHQMTNSTSHLSFGDAAYRENEPMLSLADLTRMTELGWRPKVDLKRGLQLIIESYAQKECGS